MAFLASQQYVLPRADARQDSLINILEPSRATITKTHFVEWFSGDILDPIWDTQTIIGTITAFDMVDAVNQGFRILTSTTLPSRGCVVAANTERHFDPRNCVMEAVNRSTPTNFQNSVGFGNRSDGDMGNTPDEAMFYQQPSQLTFERFSTIRASSQTAVNTTVVINTNFNHTKQELDSTKAQLFINGILEATIVTDLPLSSSKLYAGFCCQNTGAAVATEIRVTFMEAYNK